MWIAQEAQLTGNVHDWCILMEGTHWKTQVQLDVTDIQTVFFILTMRQIRTKIAPVEIRKGVSAKSMYGVSPSSSTGTGLAIELLVELELPVKLPVKLPCSLSTL